MTESFVLTSAERGVDELIAALGRRGYTVIGPSVRDGAIVLDELRDASSLPVGWTDEQEAATYRVRHGEDRSLFAYAVGPQSPRRYLSPPRKTLWSAVRVDGGFQFDEDGAEPPAYAFLGVRACELAAIAVQDRVLRDGPYPDPSYVRARERAFFIGVNCGSPAATCFCTSMGTGPSVDAGHDLAVDGVAHRRRPRVAGRDRQRAWCRGCPLKFSRSPPGDRRPTTTSRQRTPSSPRAL